MRYFPEPTCLVLGIVLASTFLRHALSFPIAPSKRRVYLYRSTLSGISRADPSPLGPLPCFTLPDSKRYKTWKLEQDQRNNNPYNKSRSARVNRASSVLLENTSVSKSLVPWRRPFPINKQVVVDFVCQWLQVNNCNLYPTPQSPPRVQMADNWWVRMAETENMDLQISPNDYSRGQHVQTNSNYGTLRRIRKRLRYTRNYERFTHNINSAVWKKRKMIYKKRRHVCGPFDAHLCHEHQTIVFQKQQKGFIGSPVYGDCTFFDLDQEMAALTCKSLSDLRLTKDLRFKNNRIISVGVHREPILKQRLHVCGLEREGEADIREVLSIYNERGALIADNALERTIERKKHLPCAVHGLAILQFALRSELGAGTGDIRSVCNVSSMLQNPFSIGSLLSRAVFSWALFVHVRAKYPSASTASKLNVVFARHVIAYASRPQAASEMPKDWILQASSSLQTAKPEASPSSTASGEQSSPPKVNASENWAMFARNDLAAPVAMTDIMLMVGIEEVKAVFVELYSRSKVAHEQNRSHFLFNARLEGNPGTGKTTVAMHYAEFLKQLRVIPASAKFVEISGADLSMKGVTLFEEHMQMVNGDDGGVIFIDNAPEMETTREGLQVISHLLQIANKQKSVVLLLSGLTKDMEKLSEKNPTLQSRFPVEFPFSDFTDDELLKLFYHFMEFESGPVTEQTIVGEPSTVNMPKLDHNQVSELVKKYGIPKEGDVEVDEFGHHWRHDGKVWANDCKGICGYSPKCLGTMSNPLVFGYKSWVWSKQNSKWTTTNGKPESLEWYPGSKPLHTDMTRKQNVTKFHCEDEKFARIAMKRIGRQRGNEGFQNAHAVITFFNQVRSKQARRILQERHFDGNPDIFLLKRDDLLGPKVTVTTLKASHAYKELQEMEGLWTVKKSVDDLIKLAVENARREEEELPTLEIITNRVFLGNPGTGKTTVARIYAQLLTEMNLLSKGEVILKTSSDFMDSVVGSSEKQTRAILRAAQGSVLVIDEAYTLSSSDGVSGSKGMNSFGAAVINTLVEQIQAKPGDDRAVLLLGYQEEMERMFKDANPGLARRFPLEQAFVFEDYDDEALLRILLSNVKKNGLQIDFPCAKRAIASLSKARAKPHFGNAGVIDSLLSAAKLKLEAGDDKLVLSHFGLHEESVEDDTLDKILDDLVGCDGVKGKLQDLRDTVLFAQSRGESPKEHIGYNYLFLGNPGTGKTTVARRMGKMFKALGLLPDDTVHEVSASDLVTGYMGQASKRTRDMLQMSRGGVLMIDEAYQLNPEQGGGYMTEVVDELVKCLTSREFQGKLLVLLAGYGEDMEKMLKSNPGLTSRFTERIHFEDMTAVDAAKLMMYKMSKRRLPVSASDWNGLLALAERLVTLKDFANGRDVDTWSSISYQEVSRDAKITQFQKTRNVTLQQMEAALNRLFRDRMPHHDLTSTVTSINSEPPVSRSTATQLRTASATARKELRLFSFAQKYDWNGGAVNNQSSDSDSLNITEMNNQPFNPFIAMGKELLLKIQDSLSALGMHTIQDMARLSVLKITDPAVQGLVNQLLTKGMSLDMAVEGVRAWQQAHRATQARLAKPKSSGMQAIWRCAACNRGGEPWIICAFAPYIERFEPVPL